MKYLHSFGKYCMLIGRSFSRVDKWSVFWRSVIHEIDKLGMGSVVIVSIISFFIGAVIAIQLAVQISSPLIPKFTIGYGTRDTLILEFSSTVIGLILAGKVGSNIASELGSMRVSEQIDALEIMGINSANYLILPKIVAAVIINPILTIMSIILGIVGGYIGVVASGMVDGETFIYGAQYYFVPYYVVYGLIKTVVFAFIITSIACFRGYYVEGGSEEVGKASTKAVVNASIAILFWNLILTTLLLL